MIHWLPTGHKVADKSPRVPHAQTQPIGPSPQIILHAQISQVKPPHTDGSKSRDGRGGNDQHTRRQIQKRQGPLRRPTHEAADPEEKKPSPMRPSPLVLAEVRQGHGTVVEVHREGCRRPRSDCETCWKSGEVTTGTFGAQKATERPDEGPRMPIGVKSTLDSPKSEVR